MTNYTMKKLWNCLVSDPRNHADLKEAIREELKNFFWGIDNDKIVDGDCYEGDGYDKNGNWFEIRLTNSEVAMLLNEGRLEKGIL